MKGTELLKLVDQGLTPILEVMDDSLSDWGPEKGMRARILSGGEESPTCITFRADFEEFRDFNLQFAPECFYGEDKKLVNWFESQEYERVETIYLAADQNNPFVLIEDESIRLYEFYLSQNPSVNYVRWLEGSYLSCLSHLNTGVKNLKTIQQRLDKTANASK